MQCNSHKIAAGFFSEIDKLILKLIRKLREPGIAKAVWKSTKLEDSHLPVSNFTEKKKKKNYTKSGSTGIKIEISPQDMQMTKST